MMLVAQTRRHNARKKQPGKHAWLAFHATRLVNVSLERTRYKYEHGALRTVRCGSTVVASDTTARNPSQWQPSNSPKMRPPSRSTRPPVHPSGGNPRKRNPRFGERLACGWEMAVEGSPRARTSELSEVPSATSGLMLQPVDSSSSARSLPANPGRVTDAA